MHKYQTISRNQIGSKLSKIFGQPIFSSRDTVFKEIKSVHEQLQEELCLKFTEQNDKVVIAAYVDVQKCLEWFLSQPRVQELVNLGTGTIVTKIH